MLSATLGIAATILGLNLMIESRTRALPRSRWPVLGRTLRRLALRVASPIGILFVLVGFLWSDVMTSWVSVGFCLIIVAITLLVASQRLINPEASARPVTVWAWTCVVIGTAAVIWPLINAIF